MIESRDVFSSLVHLNLSGMALRELVKPILISIVESSIDEKSKLIGIHLSDNEFDI